MLDLFQPRQLPSTVTGGKMGDRGRGPRDAYGAGRLRWTEPATRWVALGCVAVALWLLVIAVLYRDWLALAVALAAAFFGLAELRSHRVRGR